MSSKKNEELSSVEKPGDDSLLDTSSVISNTVPPGVDRRTFLMRSAVVGAAAVMSGDRLDGIISERDIVRALAACCTPSDVWAADVMATPPALIDGDEPIAAAAERMLDEGVRHLPVLLDGHVLSVVSMRDVLRVFSDDWRRSTRES